MSLSHETRLVVAVLIIDKAVGAVIDITSTVTTLFL